MVNINQACFYALIIIILFCDKIIDLFIVWIKFFIVQPNFFLIQTISEIDYQWLALCAAYHQS